MQVTRRPFVLMSVAVSLDGCVDDPSPRRLVLSGPEDLDRVDDVRASVDAILVGPGTIRADDPRLLVRSADRRAARTARGRPQHPLRVTISRSGGLDPAARFFTGPGETLVYGSGPGTVVGVTDPHAVLADLAARGVRRLMVEGGTAMHRLFLDAGVVDELHLAVAPVFVGDAAAPRFLGAGPPMRLVELRRVGEVALLVYRP